jgi:TonB family protein
MTQSWKQWEGQTLDGKFYLREYLGGTEHSGVFLTGDQERGVEEAAIKLVPADTANAEHQLSRWKEAAKLSHPHLIRLFQTGRGQLGNNDLLYVVMEYAELDLSQVLSQVPFPPEETRETLRVILDTLGYLHGKGLVHGHLKPANVMSINRQLKLSSDGLCRRGEWSGGRGTQGPYDPPEAESGMHSPAGDVWSFGMILVELLPQHAPAWVTTEEGDPVVPRTLPAPYYDIARNCLRWDPERRWTVAEIAARLEPAAPPAPLPAPRPQPDARPQSDARPQKTFAKRQYIVAAGAVALALAVTLAGLKLANRHRAVPNPGQTQVAHSTGQLKQRRGGKHQSSRGARPPHPSLQAGAAPKTPTGTVVQGGVRQKVLPQVPRSAMDTIRGTVRVIVKVAVDPSGNVAEATLDSPGPSKYFARLALDAARQWKFYPAEVNGRQVSKEWRLQFDFNRTAIEAIPLQTAP